MFVSTSNLREMLKGKIGLKIMPYSKTVKYFSTCVMPILVVKYDWIFILVILVKHLTRVPGNIHYELN